jgi:hypothetical protein
MLMTDPILTKNTRPLSRPWVLAQTRKGLPMTTEMNRRAILGAAATLPATALPAAALATGDDVHSALARIEYVIHVLRNCGWKIDEEGAEHALKYFRHTAARGRWIRINGLMVHVCPYPRTTPQKAPPRTFRCRTPAVHA